MACSSCAKKAALRNSRVVKRSLSIGKKINSKLNSTGAKNNQKTKTQNG